MLSHNGNTTGLNYHDETWMALTLVLFLTAVAIVYLSHAYDYRPKMLSLSAHLIGALVSCIVFLGATVYHNADEGFNISFRDYRQEVLHEISDLQTELKGGEYAFTGIVNGNKISGTIPKKFYERADNWNSGEKLYLGIKLHKRTFVAKEYSYYIIEK